jgi:Spy/CpxP family protein refolding chaperone
MTRQVLARMLALLVVAAVAVPAAAQSSFKWWQSPEVQQDLKLTPDQVSRIESIFQAALGRQRNNKTALDKLEADLSHLIESDADEATVVKQVDKVEAKRSAMNKERTLMLLHIRQVLTPEQRASYTARVDQWQRDHPRPRSSDGNRNNRSQR